MRCAHDTATDTLSGPYREEEFFDDLMCVTQGKTDQALARLMVRDSKSMLDWIQQQGVRFQPSLGGTLSLGRTNSFFLGGGRAMLNALYLTADRLGVRAVYDTEVIGLEIDDGRFVSAKVSTNGGEREIRANTLVAAAGGFEANIEWLKKGWGGIADNFLVRGTPYNRGTVLSMLIEQGAESVGDATQCHAVAIDARAPKFDGGIITRLDCVVFGIVVNKLAQRFYDEGEDVWPKRYAIWGRLVAQQPDQIAYIIFDQRSLHLFMPSLYPPISAPSMGELAAKLGLDPAALEVTVASFNGAVRPGSFDPTTSGRLPHRGPHPAEVALGPKARDAPVLCLSGPTGHHVHLSGRQGRFGGPCADAVRRAVAKHLRGR